MLKALSPISFLHSPTNERFCCEVLPKRIYLFEEKSDASWYMCGSVLLRIDHRNVAVDFTVSVVSLRIVAANNKDVRAWMRRKKNRKQDVESRLFFCRQFIRCINVDFTLRKERICE